MLAQKQTVLKQNIAATTEKLKQLKTTQDLYIKSGGNLNSPEYRELQREIIKTENDLKSLKKEASNWTQVSKKLDEVSSKMKQVGESVTKLGKNLTTKLTVPIVTLGTVATKTAMEFESAFTGVEKTVDGTIEQMAVLKQGIRDLAKQIPATTTEIAAVAEAAGQLGIQTDNILEFTRVMIDLGNSTNLAADEAATTLARFANVTKMSQSDFDKLGSVIVALGNNFATTEAEIAAMGMNLGSAGTQVGMTQPQIMALATALSSVGLEAQAGGTAFSRLMVSMQLATETGGEDLKSFAKVAGMTSKEFKKAFQEDAAGAIMKFIEGLSQSGERGESAIKILDDMEIKETRLRDSLLRSANASDVMKNALELGNQAWEENNALTNEAEKRYQTLESKMKVAKNKLSDIGITMGNYIMPYVEKFIDKLSELTQKFESLTPETQKLILKIGLIVAAIGPVLIIIGKLISFGGMIAGALSSITGAIGGLSAGVGGLSGVLAALTGPIGIAIGVIAALTAAFVLLWNKSETFRNSMIEIGQSFVKTFNEHIKPTLDNIIEIFSILWNKVLSPLIQFLWDVFKPVLEKAFTTIGNKIANIFEKVGIIFETFTGILKGMIRFITGVFTKDWGEAWKGIVEIFGSIFDGMKNLFKTPINWIIEKLNKFIGSLGQIKIPDWVPEVGGKGINIPLIPKLAKGGIVDSATLAMIGEGRSAEAVIPLDRTLTRYMAEALKMAGGNKNIVLNFYPQEMTEAELERAFNYVDRRFGVLY